LGAGAAGFWLVANRYGKQAAFVYLALLFAGIVGIANVWPVLFPAKQETEHERLEREALNSPRRAAEIEAWRRIKAAEEARKKVRENLYAEPRR
jgi:hypothetical protein